MQYPQLSVCGAAGLSQVRPEPERKFLNCRYGDILFSYLTKKKIYAIVFVKLGIIIEL